MKEMSMFGIGMPEMILILAVALIVIGPKKLPDLAKSLGKAMGEFKKATRDLKDSMQIDAELKDVKTAFDDMGKDQPREVKASTDDMDEPPKDAAATAGEPAESGDSADTDAMDQLKKAFDRQNVDSEAPPEEAAKDHGEEGHGPDLDSETQKA